MSIDRIELHIIFLRMYVPKLPLRDTETTRVLGRQVLHSNNAPYETESQAPYRRAS